MLLENVNEFFEVFDTFGLDCDLSLHDAHVCFHIADFQVCLDNVCVSWTSCHLYFFLCMNFFI